MVICSQEKGTGTPTVAQEREWENIGKLCPGRGGPVQSTFSTERSLAEGLTLCPAPISTGGASRSDCWLSGLYFQQSPK